MPGYSFEFPRDHGAHPEYRTEWWYFTGNLTAADGRAFGYELTFFRNRTAPSGFSAEGASPLVADQVYLGHFAISDIDSRVHASWERVGRVGFAQASASTRTLDISLGPWSMAMDDTGAIELLASALETGDNASAIALRLTPDKPLVIHGRDGVHVKADDPTQASHYLSFTRLTTGGTLTWRGRDYAVTGRSWMDHEFGSDKLGMVEVGWKWFALQLDNGVDLMLYRLRLADGSDAAESLSTLVYPDGRAEPLPARTNQIVATGDWTSSQSGATYPMGWQLEMPGHNARLIVTPAFEAQEMISTRGVGATYWEGAVRITGVWDGAPATGVGYVELVGYVPRATSDN